MKGIVLENKKYYSTVLTPDGRFLNIRKDRSADIGEELSFDETSIMPSTGSSIRGNIIKICSMAAIFILVCMSVFSIYQYGNYNLSVYAYVSMDINPSLEMGINKMQRVLTVKAMNTDAERLLSGLSLKNLPIQEAVKQITEKSAEQGYLSGSKDNYVIMATSANNDKTGISAEEAAKLTNALEQAGSEILSEKGMKGLVQVIQANPDLRNGAQGKGLSLGKYIVYAKAVEEGLKMDIEEFKTQSMSSALEKVGGDIKEIISQAEQVNDKSEEKNKDSKKEEKKPDINRQDNKDNGNKQGGMGNGNKKDGNKDSDSRQGSMENGNKQDDNKDNGNKQDNMGNGNKQGAGKQDESNKNGKETGNFGNSSNDSKKDTKADTKKNSQKGRQNDKR